MTHQGIVVSHFLLLPELEILSGKRLGDWGYGVDAYKRRSDAEYCPRCATRSSTVYDSRTVQLKDHPVRDKLVILRVRKRRYFCRVCKKPFTEPLVGVRKGDRCTERYRKGLRWAAETFSDLKKVQRHFRCSSSALYRDVYRQLELRRRRRLNYPWPEKVGIDEHSFRKHPIYRRTEYSTILVDHDHHRVYELLPGKQSSDLFNRLKDTPGAERVRHVTMDLSEGYRSLAQALFPNATITADKFHVLRLLVPAINRRRKRLFGSTHRSSVGRLLLRSAKTLDFAARSDIDRILKPHQELETIYRFKERLHELYRCKGTTRANQSYDRLLSDLGSHRNIPELATLARTLGRWRKEILNYFWTGLTNARTEGFNTTAKLVKRRAYGYKNHEHYRLRLLDTCFG